MCRLAVAYFDADVDQARRHKVVAQVLKNSWDLGNKHGCGIASVRSDKVDVAKALELEQLRLPETLGELVLIHARFATNDICLANTHPYVGGHAYLVHNGIVAVASKENREKLHAMRKTNNDTELILKAFLANDRSMSKALSQLAGNANLALWDADAKELLLYPDSTEFSVWRQAGVTLIVQEGAQTSGAVRSGLGHPYEYDVLPEEKLYIVNLSAEPFIPALERAIDHPIDVKRPEGPAIAYSGYTAGSYTWNAETYKGTSCGVGQLKLSPSGSLPKLTKAQRKALKRERKREQREAAQIRRIELEMAEQDAITRSQTTGGPLMGRHSRAMKGLSDSADAFVVGPGVKKRPQWLLGPFGSTYPATDDDEKQREGIGE